MINLLPNHQKEELREEEKFKIVLILGIILFSFFLSLSLSLFALKAIADSKVESQKILAEAKEKNWNSQPGKDLEKKIQDYNLTLTQLKSFYQKEINLTEILEKIYSLLPSGVYLNLFNFDRQQNLISLSGFSPTRDHLLKFKENLENQKEFGEIYFPPSNWVQPNDINFSVNFKIKEKK
jgi:Tfp pilus assembly protein PilN